MKKIVLIHFIICFFLAACAQQSIKRSPSSWLTADEEIVHVKKEIESIHGKIVNETEGRALYATLNPVFRKLSDTKKELLKEHNTVYVEEFLILDSAEINAFVYQIDRKGITEQKNIVCITTGLIELLTRPIGSETIEEATLRGTYYLAGAMAHELAHPINKLESSIKASQPQEIRADLEGVWLLKKAKYPEDSLYKALRIVFDEFNNSHEGKSRFSSIEVALGSHPEQNVRASIQRIALTYQRYTTGTNVQIVVPEVDATLRDELFKITDFSITPKKEAKNVITLTETFDEALDLVLKNLNQKKIHDEELSKSLFNLDQHISKMGQANVHEISQEQWNIVRQIVNKFLIELSGKGFDSINIDLQDKKSDRYDNLEFKPFELRQKNPFFQSDKLKSILLEALDSIDNKAERADEIAEITTFFMDQKTARQIYQEPLFESALFELEHNSKDKIKFSRYIVDSTIQDLYIDFFSYLKEKGKEHLIIKLLLRSDQFASSGSSTSFHPLNFAFKTYEGTLKRQFKNLVDQKMRPPHSDELLSLVDFIWENRGLYAASELLRSEDSRIYWNKIFEIKGISKQEGNRSVVGAFKQFTLSEDFIQMLSSREVLWDIDDAVKMKKGNHYPKWVGRDFFEHYEKILANPKVGGSSEVKEAFFRKFVLPYLSGHPGLLQSVFKQKLARQLESANNYTADTIGKKILHVLDELMLIGVPTNKGNDSYSMIINALYEANIPIGENEKKVILEILFLGNNDDCLPIEQFEVSSQQLKCLNWMNYADEAESIQKVTKALKKYGVIKYYYESLYDKKIIDLSEYGFGVVLMEHPKYEVHSRIIHLYMNDIDEILKLREPERSHHLLKLSEAFMDSELTNKSKRSVKLPLRMKAYREKIYLKLMNANLPFYTSLEIFKNMSFQGGSRQGDVYFNGLLKDYFLKDFTDDKQKFLAELLKGEQLYSPKLKAEMAELLIEQALPSFSPGKVTDTQLSLLLNQLHSIFPDQTMERDEILENIAWNLDIKLPNQLTLLESFKSYNWRTIDENLISEVSAISEELGDMDSDNIRTLIHYIVKPDNRSLPKSIRKWLVDSLREKFDKDGDKNMVTEKLEERMFLLTDFLETHASEAKAFEKIPLLEMLLNIGESPVMNDDYFVIVSEMMGYAEDDIQSKMLKAFLKSIPDNEISSTLAFMLAFRDEESNAVKPAFEAFGPAGKKAAQMTAIFELLDAHLIEQLEDLKDNAKPLTKNEVEGILRTTLSEADYSKITRVKNILGSASIKTVVEIELKSGEIVTAMVQSPHAANLIQSSIVFAKEFLSNLANELSQIDMNLLAGMIEDVEDLLHLELDMKREAQNIKEAFQYYTEYNKKFKHSKKHNGWRVEVPLVVPEFEIYDNVLFVDKAPGVIFKDLSAAAKIPAGYVATHSTVHGIFTSGWFDKDRHKGNFFFDEKEKVIYFIDAGQVTSLENTKSPFKQDDRLMLAELFNAIDKDSPQQISRALVKMSDGDLSANQFQKLQAKISMLLKQNLDNKTFLAKIINLMPELGVPLKKKFSFETLKALMIVYAEKYVSEEVFKEIMTKEVRTTFYKKAPIGCYEYLKNLFLNFNYTF